MLGYRDKELEFFDKHPGDERVSWIILALEYKNQGGGLLGRADMVSG